MKIKLGIRGSTDAINHIIIKLDDLMLITADNLFLTGEESRNKTGKNLVELLNTPAKRSRNICWGKCCQGNRKRIKYKTRNFK